MFERSELWLLGLSLEMTREKHPVASLLLGFCAMAKVSRKGFSLRKIVFKLNLNVHFLLFCCDIKKRNSGRTKSGERRN